MEQTYLDNSATTAVCREAAEKALHMMTVCYGNPSSLHRLGFEAERELADAREAVAGLMGVAARDIFFTSGGSEANNLAVFGAVHARERRGKHIVTTALEHSSVAEACNRLEKDGFEVTRLIPNKAGDISVDAIVDACRADTVLVSVMMVNNETGARFPIEQAVTRIRKKAPLAFIHCDAVQAAGKLPLHAEKWQVDAMTVSAHKIHGPKGVGALYVKRGSRILPRQYGGKQQEGIRPGTEAAPLIAAFGAAVKALPPFHEQQAIFDRLKQYLLQKLEQIPGVVLHLPQSCVSYIVHLSVPGLRSETVLHFLSERNVFVSSGSACSKGAKSPVLIAAGLPNDEIDSAVRVSFSHHNTVADIDRFVDGLAEAVQLLARKK